MDGITRPSVALGGPWIDLLAERAVYAVQGRSDTGSTVHLTDIDRSRLDGRWPASRHPSGLSSSWPLGPCRAARHRGRSCVPHARGLVALGSRSAPTPTPGRALL